MSIKAKQVAGVTTLVVGVVAVLSAYHLATLARRSLEETSVRGELLAHAIFIRAEEVVRTAGGAGEEIYTALRDDGGVRAILGSSAKYPNVTYAAIVDTEGRAIAHMLRSLEGTTIPEQEPLARVLELSSFQQWMAVRSDHTYEVRQPLYVGDQPFGSIRIGVDTVLVQGELNDALERAAGTVLAALLLSSLVAMLLAQWMLRPIHVIQSSLSRLGRGELDVRLDLPGQEFRDLGSSFEAVSAQLSAVRAKGGSASTDFESVMENLEDAVALFSPSGEVIFRNTAMASLVPAVGDGNSSNIAALPAQHPVRHLVEQALAGRKSAGPVSASSVELQRGPEGSGAGGPGIQGAGLLRASGEPEEREGEPAKGDTERMLMCHAIQDSSGRFLGAMLVARNVGYLTQVHSTLNYSRKLAALGRLMAGVAHEVKNPLNAMTIHLELLKQKLARRPAAVAAPASGGSAPGEASVDLSKHVTVISDEIRRLDQVVGGFLKFARPEELKLQPVKLDTLISDVVTTAKPEAEQHRVNVKVDCPPSLPPVNGDPAMLRQALLNLVLNACQAMPDGGTLRIACRATARRRIEIDVEDTGVGIPPEHLGRIFDLYFTTRQRGSGIGLSMVYRIVQLHDGEIDVESTPGSGTRFRLKFAQA